MIDQLLDDPHRFQFFQAVRLIERWLADAERHGGRSDELPAQLRFHNSTALSFGASEIESLKVAFKAMVQGEEPAADARPQRIDITPAFMGLLGVAGALPLVYTEQLLQREQQDKDAAARAFLDLFSHRAVSLFYAAWKKHRLHIQYESNRRDRFAPLALAIAGLGQNGLRERLRARHGGVPDESLAFFAGTLQRRALSARQLEQVLAGYLKVPVRVEQFCGRWYTLPAAARNALGSGNAILGRNTVCGERVWQRDLRVKILLGPLDHAHFRRFLPGAPGATALREIVALLSGVSLEYEVNLVLKAEAVQGCALGSGRSPLVGRLGWDTYLQAGHPTAADRCDVRYDVHAAAAA